MTRKLKILILRLLIIISVAVLLFWGFFKLFSPKKPLEERFIQSYQSRMKPLDVSELNVILITIDTLRADHLECYGYPDVETPNINRLAQDGTRFKYETIQVPLTFPSHSTIMTGTYPLYHGVRDNGGFYLDDKHITLAEVLKQQDYATAAFVAAFVLDSRWGLDQGFDYYYDNFDLTKYKKVSLDAVQRRGDEVLAEVYKWLEKNSKEKFFTWIHLYDPHTPYDPPEPYHELYKPVREKPFRLYDGEIAYVDQLMGEFLDYLEEKKLLDKTVIIFTSDHGESLGQHKENAHGFFIYEAATRVPLIMRFPQKKFASKVIQQRVRSVDIMPTILNFVGQKPPETVQGKSLLPLILGDDKLEEEGAYSETYWPNYHYGWSPLKSLIKGSYKFIDAPKPELYNVFEDPMEKVNLVNLQASLAHQMKRELDALIEKYSAEGIEDMGPQPIDHDSLVKLQALGYVGGFRASLRQKGERLADPKDKIELYNEIKLAQFLVSEEKFDKAEKKIRNVLSKDPSVLEALYILGNIYFRQHEYEKAIEEYKKALAIKSDYYEAILGLATTYKQMGKIEEAIVGLKHLMELDPKDTKPLLHLADIYIEKDELDLAQNYLESAVALNPDSPVFHNKLGAIYLKKKMYDLAEKEIRKALSFERHIPLQNAHFNLALLHEARGKINLAIAEYRKEQEVSPYNYKPDFNLGLLYLKLRKIEEAIKEFNNCIEKKENFAPPYIFLAKAYMDNNQELHRAVELALKGLKLNPDKETTILGHLVLADLYNRLGNYNQSQYHLDQAKQLERTPSLFKEE